MKRTTWQKRTKKWTAVSLASVLTIAGVAPVWAGSYQESEKRDTDSFVESLIKNWDLGLEIMKTDFGLTSGLTLTLEEGTRDLLTQMTGFDFSWVNSIGLEMGSAIEKGKEAIQMNVSLNDLPVVSMMEYIDFDGQMAYLQLPEFFEGAVEIPVSADASYELPDGASGEMSMEQLQAFMDIMMDIGSYLPDEKTLSEILTRYKDIVIENMAEGDSREETLTEGDFSAECTMYEGQLYGADMLKLGQELLGTAKDDEQLKELIEKVGTALGNEELYTSVQQELADAMEDMEEEDSDTESYLFSRIWTDEENRTAGRQIGICDGGEEYVILDWKDLQKDDQAYRKLEIFGDSTLTFEGNETTENGAVSGEWEIQMDGVPALYVGLEDVVQDENGNGSGTYTLQLGQGLLDEESYSMLGGYSLVMDFETAESGMDNTVDITLMQQDTALGTLTCAATLGSGMEMPDLESLGQTYDMESEADALAMLQSLDWTKLLENASAAGMPDMMVEMLNQIIYTSLFGEAADGYDAGTEDSYTDEYEDDSALDDAA